jgi:acetyl esterase/lipase
VVISYPHGGGGYALGQPLLETPNSLFIAECLAIEGLTTAIFAPRYNLMPEGHFPQQVDDVAFAYKWLVQDLGVLPSRIALIGESAGEHLALSFLLDHHLKTAQHDPLAARSMKPAGAFLVSPWCDLHNSDSKATNLRPGEVAFKRLLTIWGDFVTSDYDTQQLEMFLNSAQRNDRGGLWRDIIPSRTWILAGEDEVTFVHDIVDFVNAARDDGANVTLEIKPGG